MLIGNGRLTHKVPLTLLGRDWNAQTQEGAWVGYTWADSFGANAALPDGYYTPHGWMLPRKGGTLRAGLVTASGGASADGQSGYNIEAVLTGAGGASGPLGLIVVIAAALTASGGVSSATTQALASMVATLTGSSSVSATAQGLADLGASLLGSGGAVGSNTALMQLAATIRGYGELTPEGIRDTIWGHQIDGFSADDLLKLLLSYAANETEIIPQGAGQAIVKFKDPSGIKDRITAYMTGSTRTQVDKDVS